METLREKAQKRVTRWKNKMRFKGWEITQFTGVDETIISRLFNGRGMVSDDKCRQILEAKEPKL